MTTPENNQTKPLILVTNDDGVESPGLWAAVHALLPLARVIVAAPAHQQSGAGRALLEVGSGAIVASERPIDGVFVKTYSIDATPAQAVKTALLDLTGEPVALCVSGINYGENVGSGVTISGTVGAALQAACMGVPGLAVSLEVDHQHHTTNSHTVSFRHAAHFVSYFAARLLKKPLPPDVDVLKVDIPANATPQTKWRMAPQSRHPRFLPTPQALNARGLTAHAGYYPAPDLNGVEPGSDVAVLLVDRLVAVTPLSTDLTSRVDLAVLSADLLS